MWMDTRKSEQKHICNMFAMVGSTNILNLFCVCKPTKYQNIFMKLEEIYLCKTIMMSAEFGNAQINISCPKFNMKNATNSGLISCQ